MMKRRSREVGGVRSAVFGVAMALMAALSAVGVGGAFVLGCTTESDTVLPNPGCTQDLTILTGDAGITSVDGGSIVPGDAAVASGADGSVIFAPCALSDGAAGSVPITVTPVDDSAAPTAPSCPSYTCVCDDESTQTASMADPGSGSCESESQVCGSICTSHGGWM